MNILKYLPIILIIIIIVVFWYLDRSISKLKVQQQQHDQHLNSLASQWQSSQNSNPEPVEAPPEALGDYFLQKLAQEMGGPPESVQVPIRVQVATVGISQPTSQEPTVVSSMQVEEIAEERPKELQSVPQEPAPQAEIKEATENIPMESKKEQ